MAKRDAIMEILGGWNTASPAQIVARAGVETALDAIVLDWEKQGLGQMMPADFRLWAQEKIDKLTPEEMAELHLSGFVSAVGFAHALKPFLVQIAERTYTPKEEN